MLMIVSQDKSEVLNFDRIDRFFTTGSMICAETSSGKIVEVGGYKNHEEAKEMLAKLVEGLTRAMNIVDCHLVCIGNEEPARTSEWISVKDRLPKYNEPVLVYRPSMALKNVVDQYYGYWGEDDDEWHEGWGSKDRNTHWMPLPEPPEEE